MNTNTTDRGAILLGKLKENEFLAGTDAFPGMVQDNRTCTTSRYYGKRLGNDKKAERCCLNKQR